MRRSCAFLCAAPLLALAACGPVPLAVAERQCLDRAQSAIKPRGDFAVGVGTGGVRSRVRVDISSDFIGGRDPSAVYDQCVYQKSGRPPSQPLHTRTDWKG